MCWKGGEGEGNCCLRLRWWIGYFCSFANLNESQDSNVTAFIPPKKLNPKTKKSDERDKKPFGGTSQLDKMLKLGNLKINQSESSNIMDSSSFFQNSHLGNIGMDSKIMDLSQSEIDEYVDDDDPGFDLYECDRQYQNDTSKKLAEQYGYPERAVYKSKFKNLISNNNEVSLYKSILKKAKSVFLEEITVSTLLFSLK